MGKLKQQVISRFFTPKQSPQAAPAAAEETSQHSPPPSRPKPSPKIAATVSFSPSTTASKRSRPQSENLTVSSKKPKSSLHEKFVSKLIDPPATSSRSPPQKPLPQRSNSKYTPLEQQVLEVKSQHPDVILMVEVGYRYRFFGKDAEKASQVLGIVAHVDHNFLTASVPTFRLNFHVRRLVCAGYKVGVVKQTETSAMKAHGSNRLGPFTRGLSALYTRSTIEAGEDMGGSGEEGTPGGNYLLCVVEKGLAGDKGSLVDGCYDVKVGIIGVEISTGEVIHGEFNDNVMRSGLEAVLLSLSPAEILLGEPLSSPTKKLLLAYAGPVSNVRVEQASCDCFKDGGPVAEVMSLYEEVADDTQNMKFTETYLELPKEKEISSGIEGLMAMPELAMQAMALTMRYLKKFGLERILCFGASLRPYSTNIEMTLSANTLNQLEVLKNNFSGSVEGSLLHAMDHTCTAFGSRLLKHWVSHPLCDRNSIVARLDAVAEISESIRSSRHSGDIVLTKEISCSLALPEIGSIICQVLQLLAKSPDIQRGITRVFHQTATASEFIGVIEAILVSAKQLRLLCAEDDDNNVTLPVKYVKCALIRKLILTASSSTLISHAAKLLSSLNKEAADEGDMLNVFNISAGQFHEVASGQIAVELAKEKLDSLIIHCRKQLGIRNLNFTSVSGITHLIELSSDARVPSNWVMINSTKKMVRYHPPEVLAALDQLTLAREEFSVICRKTWAKFLTGFSKYYAQFKAAVQALAALDCLHSLAVLSRNHKYVRPTFVSDDEPCQIDINSGCHPILESLLGDNFVPNDTHLHAHGEYCQIITGPNMGGKSCYIRQVALISIMAQVGSFVPAASANLHVLDGIYTRMGASDSIQHGTSTFFEELSEASHIIKCCTSQSLVIIDELGRGTSTHDGVAIAFATLHYLLQQKGCMVLFVTHYPQILDIKNEFEGSVGAYHVSYLASWRSIVESRSEFNVKDVDEPEVTFLYKIVCGASDRSFGLNVARLAQLPRECIKKAVFVSTSLEAGTWLGNQVQCSSRKPSELLKNEYYCSDTDLEDGLFEELAKACCQVLLSIKAAFDCVNEEDFLWGLKNTRELAQMIIGSKSFYP
ncbi:DNA mismatch repair protein MSH3 [Apostasia shenzhenica]|uniref:DNA mismatch repair protein n=1 Tax=Apostasia shenzhenica TaxID=1088818 RepID=A0A2I0AR37_9ASPA|nr:DNA mismatch repair protein MSH3 [Apostasia shenzhenica]